MLHDLLADQILGRGFRPFANFTPTVPPSFWYHSNFQTFHSDLATLLLNHTGHDGWVLEVGSFIGQSGLTLARAAHRVGLEDVPIVCMDTWLGASTMWEAKGPLLGPQRGPVGEPRLFEQFLANVASSWKGRRHIIPLRASAMVGLRYLQLLINKNKIPRPKVIYLDTAHEYPETQFEAQLAWSILAPGGILTGDDYDKFWPMVQQAVNEFVLRLDPAEVAHPSTWATRWPGKRRMHHVQIVGEAAGAPTTTLPFVIRSPGQWLVKKAAPAPSPVVDPWPNGIAKPLRCCIAGWADPYLRGLGKAWCRMRGKQAGEDRRVLCERSAQRTSWYTQCRPRGSPTIQPTCRGTTPETTVGNLACPLMFACRSPMYLFNGSLSGSPDAKIAVSHFN